MAIAEGSRQLGESSLRDSSVMRVIAEDSNKVALLTRRDSTDMRIIAAVTLVFLPGTFTAVCSHLLSTHCCITLPRANGSQTLFSTSFFNFGPKDSQQAVSRWIWLYLAVAIGLTVIVLAGWYIFSQRMNRELQRSLDLKLPHALKTSQLPCRQEPINALVAPTIASECRKVAWTTAKTASPADLKLANKFESSVTACTATRTGDIALTLPRMTVASGRQLPADKLITPGKLLPMSKVTDKGVRDGDCACPICACPLQGHALSMDS